MEYNIFLDNVLNDKKKNKIVLMGDTTNNEKIAFKIKNELIKNGYLVHCVDKELKDMNELNNNIDLLILCMNPNKSINILNAFKYKINNILIQPNADNDEINEFIKSKNINYSHGCILQYFKLYKKNKPFH